MWENGTQEDIDNMYKAGREHYKKKFPNIKNEDAEKYLSYALKDREKAIKLEQIKKWSNQKNPSQAESKIINAANDNEGNIRNVLEERAISSFPSGGQKILRGINNAALGE